MNRKPPKIRNVDSRRAGISLLLALQHLTGLSPEDPSVQGGKALAKEAGVTEEDIKKAATFIEGIKDSKPVRGIWDQWKKERNQPECV